MPKKQHNHPNTHSKQGLAILMNSPAKPTTKEGLEAYREMAKASGMTTNEMLKYIGKRSHFPRQIDTDKAKQDERLENLQTE